MDTSNIVHNMWLTKWRKMSFKAYVATGSKASDSWHPSSWKMKRFFYTLNNYLWHSSYCMKSGPFAVRKRVLFSFWSWHCSENKYAIDRTLLQGCDENGWDQLSTALQMKGRYKCLVPIYIFTEMKLRNAHPRYFQNRIIMFCLTIFTFMYLWAIYIFPGSVCLFCCSQICRLILGIYESLTDTWM
jgi:hypothetical protein